MSRHSTIGLALIVYNAAGDLPNLLESVEGAFDQIALVDNRDPGSDDGTVELFRDWCARTKQPHVIDSFAWIDDYAAKRNYADSLLTTDWKCWADPDEIVYGAYNLRRLARAAKPELAGVMFPCQFHDVVYPRERLVRRGMSEWFGQVHELQRVNGPIVSLGQEFAFWSHRPKTPEEIEAGKARDRRIFEKGGQIGGVTAFKDLLGMKPR